MATCVCDGKGTHTPCRTHIFLTQFPCVAYRHRVHAWLKVFAARMSYLSISPSPCSCFIRHLCCSRTVTSTPRSRLHLPCRTVPDPQARVKRTSARAARSLATWPIPRTPHVVSPRSSTRSLLKTETRRPSTIRTAIVSPNSQKTTRESIGLFGAPTVFEASVSQVSHGVLLSREKAKKACLGKPLQDRETKEKVL